MKVRTLLECTIDTSNPAPELNATIGVVLAGLPNAEARLAVLQTLYDEIVNALEEYTTPETEAAS
ncbi:hypothetical protein [Paenibacillus sp. B-A-8]|uniref:hypothetical protein n=1 Tax=Paenibacillus sp. B-A-8 TaxID=3400419 RepID=UPI003B02D7F0